MKQVATNIAKMYNLILPACAKLASEIVSEGVVKEMSKIAKEAIEEAQMEHVEGVARRRAEDSARRERASALIVEELSEEVSDSECRSIAREEHAAVQRRLRKASSDRCTTQIHAEICNATVEEAISSLIQEFYDQEVVARREQLEAFSRATQTMRLARYFRAWRNELAGRQRLKRSMLTFPPGPSLHTPSQILENLIPDSAGASSWSVNLGNRSELTLLPPQHVYEERLKLNLRLVAQSYLKQLRMLRAWSPLNVIDVIKPNTTRKQLFERYKKEEHLYWKLAVCLPVDEDRDNIKIIQDWCEAKLKHGAVPQSVNNMQTALWSMPSAVIDETWPRQHMHVCIRALMGAGLSRNQPGTAAESLQGTCGWLFVTMMPLAEEKEWWTQDDLDEGCFRKYYAWWKQERKRLADLVNSHSVPLPAAILLCGSDGDQSELSFAIHQLNLEQLEASGAVTRYRVFAVETLEHDRSHSQLCLALRWLHGLAPPPPALRQDSMLDYVENFLTRHFYGPVYQDLASRRRKGYQDHPPDVILSLYGSLVQHLASCMSHENLQTLSWPPTEYARTGSNQSSLPSADWNSTSHQARLTQLLETAALPPWEHQLHRGSSWSQACAAVMAYAEQLGAEAETAKLKSRLRWLLRQCHANFLDYCSLLVNTPAAEPSVESLPWTDIITACVDHQVEMLRNVLANHAAESGEEVHVYYEEKTLISVLQDPLWREACNDNHTDTSTLETSVVKAVKRKHISTSHKPLAKSLRSDSLDLSSHKPSAKSLRSDSLDLSWSSELTQSENRDTPDVKQHKLTSSPLTPLQANVSFNSDVLNESVVEEKKNMDKYEQFLLQSLESGRSFSVPRSPITGGTRSPVVNLRTSSSSPRFVSSPTPMRSPQFVLRPPKSGKSSKPDPLRKVYEKTPILMDEKIENLKLMLSEQQKEDRLFEMRLNRASLMSPI